MMDALTIAHLGSALLALLVTGLMTAGFVRLARSSAGLIRHLAVGILTIHAAAFLRTLYRDIVPVVVGDDSILLSRTVFLAVALILNILIVLAGWHGLRALYHAIPHQARSRSSLLTAAMYPPRRRR